MSVGLPALRNYSSKEIGVRIGERLNELSQNNKISEIVITIIGRPVEGAGRSPFYLGTISYKDPVEWNEGLFASRLEKESESFLRSFLLTCEAEIHVSSTNGLSVRQVTYKWDPGAKND